MITVARVAGGSRAVWAAVIVIVVAALARISIQLVLGFYEHPEQWEQDVIARAIAAGGGFAIGYHGTTYYALVHPLHPFLFAAAYHLFGMTTVTAGALLVALGSAAAVAILALCLMHRLTLGVATTAGLLVALHPGLLVYSAKLHSLELDAFLLVLVALALTRYDQRPGPLSVVVTGLLSGLVALERISFLPFIVIFLGMATARRLSDRHAVIRMLAVVSVAALVVLPWSVRNMRTMGSPLVVSTGGLQLWLGNNPFAVGGAILPDGRLVFNADAAARDAVWGRPEAEQDRILRERAVRYVAEDPGSAVVRTWRKFVMFWWAGPSTGLIYPPWWTAAYLLYWTLIVGLAAVGTVRLVQGHGMPLVQLVILASVTVSLVHAVTYVEGRHRWAIEPLILALAAVGATAAFDQGMRRWRSVTAPWPDSHVRESF